MSCWTCCATGVTERAERLAMLAETHTAHARLLVVEKELKDLHEKHNALLVEHKALQEKYNALQEKYNALLAEHNALLAERAEEKAASQSVHVALQNLMYEPFSEQRRGFEIHKILYGCG